MTAASPSTSSAPVDRRNWSRTGLRIGGGWLIACLLVFLWWAGGYRSLVRRLAEWQFAHLGRYYPSLTVGILVIALSLPTMLLILWRQHRRRRADRSLTHAPAAMFARAIRSAERGRRLFGALALVTLLVAAGVFASLLWLPSDQGSVRSITGQEGAVQPEGAAAYARPFRIGRVARIIENVGLARRVMYVAPVHLPHGLDEGRLLTMVDVVPGPTLRFAPIASGVLVERGLPGELVDLYHAAGVPVPTRSYLLMADGATMRWRTLVLGVQVAALALIAGIVSLLLRRQARRLRRVRHEQRLPAT